jgi:hypothetical protein
MSSHLRAVTISIVALLVASAIELTATADPSQRALLAAWKGRTVVVRQRLFTLVYNERGRLGKTYSGRREGLTVATPDNGAYLQFDGRQHRGDVVVRDPQLMTAAVAREYEGDQLDVRTYSRLEPIVIVQYDAGMQLVVSSVDFGTDTVRLTLSQPDGPEGPDAPMTALTVKWPVPFSKSFSEREQVERLIRAFIDFPAAR